MNGIVDYTRPSSLAEALEQKAANPGAAWLAGGTGILAGDSRPRPAALIDVGRLLPRAIRMADGELLMGAGASFQDIADCDLVPASLREAALTMVNRNTRNRATIGGNLGANKSCASLIPLLLVLDAKLIVEGGKKTRLGAAEWLADRSGLVLEAAIASDPGRRSSYLRWARSSCDLSVLTVAVSCIVTSAGLSSLRIAMGGLASHARRFGELEALFEGMALPPREAIEAASAPLFNPIDDLRASAAFKRLRAATLLADAMHAAAGSALAASSPAATPGVRQ